MQIEWNKRSIDCYTQVFQADFTEEVSAESVVPDVMPDMEEILGAQGTVCLRSKEHQDGHLILTANISLTVLYLASEQPCPQYLRMEIPFQKDICAPEIQGQNISHAEIRISTLSARALNPRKVQVTAGLLLHAESFLPELITLAGGVSDTDGSAIYAKTETLTADTITGVSEKSFVLTDEYPLSGTRSPAKELISQQVSLLPEETKFVGTKLIFKGIIKTDLLWLSEDENLNVSSFSSGFSQIMELENVEESAAADVSLTLTGSFFEMLYNSNEGRSVSAQINILAQVKCTERQSLRYISDVYSNTVALLPTFDEGRAFSTRQQEVRKDNMRGIIELPVTVREILQTLPRVGKWAETENGFSCPVNVFLLFRDTEGVLHGIERCFSARWEPGETGADSRVRPEHIFCEEAYASAAPNGIEVRLLVQAVMTTEEYSRISPLEQLEPLEDAPVDMEALPSVTVLPEKSGDLWQLAKQYHSTVEAIEAANRDESRSVLLIPKAR